MPTAPAPASLLNLADGSDVLEALAEATRGKDAWLQGVGQMEDVELRVAGEGADPRRRLRGRYVVASLMGPAGGPYGVVLSRDVAGQTEVVSGQLIAARSAGVTIVVLPIGAAAAIRPAVADPLPERAAESPAPAPVQSSWARSAAATAALTRLRQPEPREEAVYPDSGDLVQHFAFGLCDVLIAEDESLKIRDRDGPGRIREIRLDKLRVLPPVERDGKRLFKLERKL